jgi:hypothetical protein
VRLRIAMWSGPRNISTALMRSWGNRPDTFVIDEPFYAHFLLRTGADHPGAGEVIAHHETNWRRIVETLVDDEFPPGKSIFYQKHMAHHLLPDIGRRWLDRVTHCLLIRNPREMVASLLRFLPEPTLEDTGLPQQVEIFKSAQEHTKTVPAVIDARDVLEDPAGTIGLLCSKLAVPFHNEMLRWPPGRRDTDGIWAKHWYAAVVNSTGFQPIVQKEVTIPPRLNALIDSCETLYQQLFSHRLAVTKPQ